MSLPTPGMLIAQRYRLSAPLGAGGQGSVWEAIDTRRAGSLCAIKFASGTRAQRSELEALLALEHPSLPRALDHGTHDDGTFLALERIAGVPLSHRMEPRRVFRALADVALGLAALHEHGLLHADVKPANILVGDDRAWLVDLGMAQSFTSVRDLSGTLAFLSPETLAGDRGPASDLYALGVSAVMALTGQHPLVTDPSDRNAVLRALASRAPARADVLAQVPQAAREAVSQLLLPDAEARGGSARAWLGRFARDVDAELSVSQRTQALALRPERPARLPLEGRDRERMAAENALWNALSGRGVGAILIGPEGSGRRRVAEEAIRSVMIRAAGEGEPPEVLEEIPTEATRATVVRMFDAPVEAVRAAAAAIERLARFAETGRPVALIATCNGAVGIAGADEIAMEPVAPEAFARVLDAFSGRALEASTVRAWREATDGRIGRAVTLAEQLEPETVASATREDLSRAIAREAPSELPRDISAAGHFVFAVLLIAGEGLTRDEIASIQGEPVAAAVGELIRHGVAWERDRLVRLTHRAAWDALAGRGSADVARKLVGAEPLLRPERVGARARAAYIAGDLGLAERCAAEFARKPGLSPTERLEWLGLAEASSADPAPYTIRAARLHLIRGEARDALSAVASVEHSVAVDLLRADAVRRGGFRDESRDLLARLREGTRPDAHALAHMLEARDALDRGETQAAHEALAQIAGDAAVPTLLRSRLDETAALVALADGDADAAIAHVRAAEEHAGDELDDNQRARLRSIAGMAHQSRGRYPTALAAYRDAWRLATSDGDLHAAATYAVNLGAAELECGELGNAAHWLSLGARVLAKLGRMGELARALANLASLHAFIGNRTHALETSVRAERAASDAGDGATEALARMIGAEVSLSGDAAGEALESAASASLRGGNRALAHDALARAAICFARAGSLERARHAVEQSGEAPAPLRAIARLEVGIAGRAEPAVLVQLASDAREAIAREPTLEHELHVLALAVRVADASGDAEQARRSREAHAARVNALAATLRDALSAVFRDVHALSDAPSPASFALSSSRISTGDARWRRLVEIAREINSEHRLRPLLEKVMDAIIEMTGAGRGFLLLKALDGTLSVRTARNIGRRDLAGEEMALSRSVAERVARTGDALVTVDASTDRRLDAFESVHSMRLRSILAVPLVLQGETVGTVYVDDRFRTRAFGDDALEIAREFAEAAAIAIQNARTKALLRRALHKSERLSRELRKRVDAQTVELEATKRALAVLPETRGRYDELIGRGPAIQRTLQLVDKVAPTAMPVLLLGESGTGKELVARALHRNGPRSNRPFVAENCGAIPETLLESVLFGHLKGAFTGADRTRAGLFEVADGGTLFLDEIGEMSPPMQAKLLRVLQDGEVRPLGGERSRKVDVRVIAATHRDLPEMVRQGRFREDLYYRLAVMVIPIPPLRQRREDIPALVMHFIQKHAHREIAVERRALARLMAHAWPGNVRQLENEMMRACVMADGAIHEEDLSPAITSQPAPVDGPDRDPLDLRHAVEEVERRLIEQALRAHSGNQSRAAKALGLSRFGLQKKLKRLARTGETAPEE